VAVRPLTQSKHIIEEIVHPVGHLPELYEDARSGKCKI